MGSGHLNWFKDNIVENGKLASICNINPDKLQEKIKTSTFVKQEVKEVESNFSISSHKA